MAPRAHILCVPFLGAGHAVNMFNVAVTLATADVQVHVIVVSQKNADKHMKATGQDHNPNVHVVVAGDGQWEDWHSEDPRQMMMFFAGPELAGAVEDKFKQIKEENRKENVTAVIYNGLMTSLTPIIKAHGLQGFLLMPVPYYMMRLSLALMPGDTPDTDITFKGIGGSEEDMPAKLGDAIAMFGPMWSAFSSSLSTTDGLIYSNTNTGLEGAQYRQPDMNRNELKQGAEYMIGPILPTWLEHGLDRPELLQKREKALADDECIAFLDRQAEKSVVYIALGSHCQFKLEQALLVVEKLRRTNTKWILLYRHETQTVVDALGGDFQDGVVTSWAPQVEVMVHASLKCVLSHGGFGTMIEGVFAGVPFITSPVMSDQFLDTRVMKLLGICVGCIAEFTHEDAIARGQLYPTFADDGGRQIETLFDHIFGTAGGERALENARAASKRLRRRMLDVKATDGVRQLQRLREVIATPLKSS